MGLDEDAEISHEQRVQRRMQIVYTRETHQRQVFMQELTEFRKEQDKERFKLIKEGVGPRWYQVLSVSQREALDSLATCIYQDILEGRPQRTANVMKVLGLFPRPKRTDLMTCVYLGRNDEKEMLAQLYHVTFGCSIEVKRLSYNLNARLMLSGILYLGMSNLIHLLRERFRPDTKRPESPPKPKPKLEPPPPSPYLQKLVAYLYERPKRKRFRPDPLPNLDELNEPFEEEPPVIPKAPPPPPPQPRPKRTIPRETCDELAGIYQLEPPAPLLEISIKKPLKGGSRKGRSSKSSLPEGKKVYGMGTSTRKAKGIRKKPVPPPVIMANIQYTINGVFEINGKPSYVLGSIAILPAEGELIHGGYRNLHGQSILINCGYRGRPPPPKSGQCDCVKMWHDAALKYVKDTKCYCGHYYDFGNEGVFPPDELPFFTKPKRFAPMEFHYGTIFNTDEKELHVEKEFRKIWDTDSVLRVDDGTQVKTVRKKKKKSSTTCLGTNPKPEDYLKCALRFMRAVNIAARLPDLHTVPELKEWMRRRIYGPLSHIAKGELLLKSNTCWQIMQNLAVRGFGHVSPPRAEEFTKHTTWLKKQKLNEKFRKFTKKYRLSVYRSHAYVTNLFWRTMFQAELPDKQFRAIFFSYLTSRIEDLHLIQSYNAKEAKERAMVMAARRVVCLPAGADLIES